MSKKVLKLGLSFIVVVMIILNVRYNHRVFADKINYEEYIKSIRIIDNKGRDEKWFKGYRIEDGKIILKVSEDNVDLFWDWKKSGNLEWKDLIIETNNIEKIIVRNPINLPANDEYEFNKAEGIEKFEAKAEEWRNGINFKELGADVEYIDEDDGDFIEREVYFSEEAPLEFTFITTDGQSFPLSWKVVEYKEENSEEDEFKVEISITQQSYDDTAKSGIVKEIDGEETLVSYGEYKIGDSVTIKAIDGDQSEFEEWYSTKYYENPPEEHNPDEYIRLGEFIGDITEKELKFTIDEKFKNIKNDGKKCKLSINASFNILNKIYINTEPENDKLIATADREAVSGGEEFTIEARGEDENWIFGNWEIYPIITGAHTPNPNADLTKPKLTLTMVDVNIQIPEERFKLYITANFREKDEEPEIEKIEPIVMEVYMGDTYDLPEEVDAIMTDGSKRMIKVNNWNPPTPYSIVEEKEYSHFGKAQEKTVELKIKGIKREEKPKYNINFETNGGNDMASIEVEEGQKITKPTNPTKEGHKFIDWYEDSNLTKEFNFDTPITKNITLYAKWEEEPLQEILEIKSVELIKDGQTISKGIIKSKTITLELPEGFDEIINQGKHALKITGTEGTHISQNRGYDGPIEEWAVGKVSNNLMPGQLAEFIIYKGDNSVEYIIKIEESTVKKYTVTFSTNGGNDMSSIEVEKGQKLTKPTDPIKEGYKFISWYEDSSLTKEFSFNIEITKDLTLYAKWEKEEPTKEYTVNFNTNGGSSINSKKVTAGEKVSRPSDPTKSNYKFIGWYEDANLTKVFNFNTPITKDITLYAKWEKAEKPEPEKPVEKKDAKILSFKLLGVEGSINHSTGKIYVNLPYTTSLRDLIPVITYSEGATISPDIGVAKDFDRIVRYIVSGNDFNSKTYEVDVSMPREKEYEEIINRDTDWYRDRRRSRRDEKDWYEITQEIKKERLKEEERKTRSEIRDEALEEVRKITAQSENVRRDLSFTQFSNYMEVRLNIIGMNDLYKNKINIPAGVLKNLKELEFDYIKYNTGSLGIRIYPAMDSPDGVYINIKPAPNEPYNNIQSAWSKIKGAGRLFEIEANSTKAGLSIEMRLDKFLPAEYIRVVKYNYMKRQFEDLVPEKWSIIDGYIHIQQVSGGIYGVIYKR